MKINEMFAFVATEEDGSEGVIAMNNGGAWMPLVGADMARVDSLKQYAQEVAIATGKEVKLVRFSVREELDAFTPGKH